jgi:hypothetical protein
MRTILAGILLLMGVAVPLDAQRRGAPASGPVTFAIVVTNPSGAPISDARVTVSGPVERRTRTERGRAVFEGLPSGTYRVRFEKDGYVPFEREVAGRGSKPIDVKVSLTPLLGPPLKPVGPLPPQQIDPKLVVLDMPAFIEKNFVGRASGKTTPLGCSMGGSGTLLQLNEPIAEHRHDDADEFVYVIAGEGVAKFGQREEPLGPAVFLMIPRHMSHTITTGKKKPLVMMSVRAGEGCR